MAGVAPEGGGKRATDPRRGTLAPSVAEKSTVRGIIFTDHNTFTHCTNYEYLLLIQPIHIGFFLYCQI